MADNKVYITLEVDDKGSATLKQFGGNADNTFGKLKTHTSDSSTQAGSMEKSWSGSLGKIEKNWKTYAAAAGVAIAAVGYVVKEFASASIDAYSEHDAAMTDMGKITDQSAESIAAAIGSIGPEYGDATELTQAYYNVISAGVTEPVAALDTLTVSVATAKAAHMDSAEAVSGITALMEAYGGSIGGASESADLLFQIEASGKTTVAELIPYIGELAGKSAALGISQDELGASFSQVTLLAGSTSNAATQYKAILTSLMAPSETMTDLLEDYGGAQKAIADLGFEGVLNLIADASGGNAAELQKLMGSAEAVGGTLTLLNDDMAGYTSRLEDMTGKTGLADQAFDDWKESMEGIEATYDASIKNIMIAFGEEIAPMVKSSMQWIIDNADTMISAMQTAFDFISWGFEQISLASIYFTDVVMRGLIDLEYAFKTMGAAIEWVWDNSIDALEEGFADFLDEVATGLDKIPFFSDNATASMRNLAEEVRANTDTSKGFVATIMEVQAAKEKEVAAHNDVITAMVAEALGYTSVAKTASKAETDIKKAVEDSAKAQVDAAEDAAEDREDAAEEMSKSILKLEEDLTDDINKLTMDEFEYKEWALEKEIDALIDKAEEEEDILDQIQEYYELKLEEMVEEKEDAADKEVEAAEKAASEQKELFDEMTLAHGSMLDGMALGLEELTDFQITWAEAGYDIVVGFSDNAKDAFATGFKDILTGDFDDIGELWDNLWDGMADTLAQTLADMVVDWAVIGAKSWLTSEGLGSAWDWVSGFFDTGAWQIKEDSLAYVHAGEMIIPAAVASSIRAGNEDIATVSPPGGWGTGETIDQDVLDVGLESLQATYASYSISAVLGYASGKIESLTDLAATLASPYTAMQAVLGGVTSMVADEMGWTSTSADIGKVMAGVLAAALGGGPVAGIAALAGALLGELLGDALDIRDYEPYLDVAEDMGYSYGDSKAIVDAITNRLETDWQVDPLTGLSFGISLTDLHATPQDVTTEFLNQLQYQLDQPTGGGDGGWGQGGAGDWSDSGAWSYDTSSSDGSDGGYDTSDDYDGSYGGDYFRRGGLARSASIFGEHGPEWAVPTYEPERSSFLRDVGVDTDQIGAILAQKAGEGGSRGAMLQINAPLIHIEGNLVADEGVFNDFVEKIDRRLYKLRKRGH